MNPLRPRARLATHDVTNQAPPFEDVNLFISDVALQQAVLRAGAEAHRERMVAFGAQAGSSRLALLASLANRNPPELMSFDRFGRRIDEVEFHPAYHELMAIGFEAGVASAAWSGLANGNVLHAALEFLMAQAEAGVCCPMTMTYAAPAALLRQPSLAAHWMPRILAANYDPSSQPSGDKTAVTIGMAMTEKQGGSDVRSNTTRAVPLSDRGAGKPYALNGHKWFCSAPMSDAFVTLAYTDRGLSCFLAPRWTPDGTRNAIEIMRLKDKLGDRANASAEIEYRDAYAEMIGEEGRGVRTIIEMVQHTRLDCAIAPAAYMRQSLANALWHALHRSAFEKKLIDQPLMRQVLADMAVESEAATALAFRVAQSFDDAHANKAAAMLSRVVTPAAKYWINRRVVNFVYEAMEVHGGGGYVEEGVMPRVFRQSPLNSIWEGSGNVICLDVLRALKREPDSAIAFVTELEAARGAYGALDTAIDRVKTTVKTTLARAADEAGARGLVEDLAVALQAGLLARHAPPAVADAFCATRLAPERRASYGASEARIDCDAILARAMPQF